jgi:hypothetical protein
MFKFFSSVVFVAQASGALFPHLSDHGADVTSTLVASSISTSTGTVVNTSSKLPVEWVYITEYTTVYPTPSSITASLSVQAIQNTTRLHRPKLSAYVGELLSGAQQSAYASNPADSETTLLSVTFTTPYVPLNTACLTCGPGIPASASSRSSTSLGSSLKESSSPMQSTWNRTSGQAGTPATSNSALCPDYSFASQSLCVYPNITSSIINPSSLAPIAPLTSSPPPSSASTPTILNSSQTPDPINIPSPPAMPSESTPAVVIVPITLTPPLPVALAYPALQKRHNSDDDEPDDAPSDDTTITSTTTRKTTITVSSVISSARPTLTTKFSRPSNRPQTSPSSSSAAAVITSLLPPDARCPYPYPGVQCAQRTTLVTKSTSTSTKAKAKETTKWCPYPGRVCLTT